MSNIQRLRARYKLIKSICQRHDSERIAAGRIKPTRQEWELNYETGVK